MPIAEAMLLGAMSLFGEKYGDGASLKSAASSSASCAQQAHAGSSAEIGLDPADRGPLLAR